MIKLLKDYGTSKKGLTITVTNDAGKKLLKNGGGTFVFTDDPAYKAPAKTN